MSVADKDSTNPDARIEKTLDGFGQLVASRLNEHWSAALLTWMFKDIPGSCSTIVKAIHKAVERTYATLVTRVDRSPRRRAHIHRIPILIGSVDAPVAKRQTSSSAGREATINGGLHAHGILLTPPVSRLRCSVADHLAANQHLYVPSDSRILRLHVVPIESDPERVTDYALKGIKNGRLDYDDAIIVLPRALSELPDRRA